jgi:hypothetical protein
VFFGTGRYQPETAAGQRLIRHELAHAANHSPQEVHLKRVTRRLDFVKVNKIPIGLHLTLLAAMLQWPMKGLADRIRPKEGQRDGGHWWVELGSAATDGSWSPFESYGWWPELQEDGIRPPGGKPLWFWELFKMKRVEGVLNQGRAEPRDPHHGHEAKDDYFPAVEVEETMSYEAIRALYTKRIRDFAYGFEGSWNWRFGWGKNCHTFIERLERRLGARRDDGAPLLTDPRQNAALDALLDVPKDERDFALKFASLRGLPGFLLVKELKWLKGEYLPAGEAPAVSGFDLSLLAGSYDAMVALPKLVGCDPATLQRAFETVWGNQWKGNFRRPRHRPPRRRLPERPPS